jgi:hypothetical protein
MSGKDLARLAIALLLGAALAFPAGMMAGRLGSDKLPAEPDRPRNTTGVRDVFAPAMRSDPWFIEQQRDGVEALERHCRRTGETCAEAREARRWLDRQGG